ncbi:hypothetical protein CASFOL_006357 [Castilleja foliolosa]|uniref:Uncharacterized protein n=1 Tax=Castilleja foliolosa TaxID=1961234 RepID=A0ABD3EA58_9LAMI
MATLSRQSFITGFVADVANFGLGIFEFDNWTMTIEPGVVNGAGHPSILAEESACHAPGNREDVANIGDIGLLEFFDIFLFQASVDFVAGNDGGERIEKLRPAGFIADVQLIVIIIVAAVEIHGRG